MIRVALLSACLVLLQTAPSDAGGLDWLGASSCGKERSHNFYYGQKLPYQRDRDNVLPEEARDWNGSLVPSTMPFRQPITNESPGFTPIMENCLAYLNEITIVHRTESLLIETVICDQAK